MKKNPWYTKDFTNLASQIQFLLRHIPYTYDSTQQPICLFIITSF